MAELKAFEVMESIRFFASLVGTEGVSEGAKKTANNYLERLLKTLERTVQDTVAASSDLAIVRGG